jgi:type IV secretion system protein VirB11
MNAPVALNAYLERFAPYFARPNVTEICINRPKEIWVEQDGKFLRFDDDKLTENFLWQFAQLVAEANDREISREHPTLSSSLPNGLRIQFVIAPACGRDSFICAIRQKAVRQTTLSQYFVDKSHVIKQADLQYSLSPEEETLLRVYHQQDHETFLRLAVLHKKNIIVSGGTSTGKTTFLNALLQHVPLEERLITIETDREVSSPHPNAVHLLAAEEGKSVANITMLGLLKASLRLRPDRILVSELRAEEAFPYLRAINSGHPGSITTIHADSPLTCFDQLAFMVMQGGSGLSRQELIVYAKSIINIIVQLKRAPEGERYISEIYFDQAQQGGKQ